ALSYLSYTYVETPLRKDSNKSFLMFSGIGYIVLMGLLYLMPNISERLSNIPTEFSKPIHGMSSHGKTFKEVEVFGDITALNDSILLIGDSHARCYKAFLDTIGKTNNFNFRAITNNKYPLIPGIEKSDFPNLWEYEQYSKLIAITEKEIQKSNVILISSYWYNKIETIPQGLELMMKNIGKDKKVIILS